MKKIVFIILVFNSLLLNSQNQLKKGYYGKKFNLTANIKTNIPGIYNLISHQNGISGYNDVLYRNYNWINYGYNFSFGYCINKQLIINIESGTYNSSIYLPQLINYLDDEYVIRAESMDISSKNFGLNLEIYSKKSLAPLGLAHQIRFNIYNSTIKNKDYNAKISKYPYSHYHKLMNEYLKDDFTSLDPEFLKTNLYNKNDKSAFKNYSLSYGLIMNSSLLKNLIISYGLKYQLNIGKSSSNDIDDNNFLFSRKTIHNKINSMYFSNIIIFNFGLKLIF